MKDTIASVETDARNMIEADGQQVAYLHVFEVDVEDGVSQLYGVVYATKNLGGGIFRITHWDYFNPDPAEATRKWEVRKTMVVTDSSFKGIAKLITGK